MTGAPVTSEFSGMTGMIGMEGMAVILECRERLEFLECL